MKSFCLTALTLFVSLGWAASAAQAQSGGFGMPTLLPLPTAATGGALPANYKPSAATVEPYNSMFASHKPESVPQPVAAGDQPARSEFEEALHSSGWGDCGDCCDQPCGHWFGSLGGLAMTRNRANPFWTTFETNNNANQLMNTQNAEAGWAGGGQVTVGYGWCGCAGPALAFTYWGLAPMTGFASIRDPNDQLSTPINLNTQAGQVMIGANPAASFFDNSREHRIARDDRVQNFELNLLQTGWNMGRLQLTALAGFRYFRFDERLSFGAVAGGFEFGSNGGANEAYLSLRSTNNMFGGQIGGNVNYMVTPRLGAFVTPKVGIYGNQMTCRNQLYTGDGQVGFDITGHKSDVAFLGEIDTGLNYAFTPNLKAYIGYRVVGVANVALSDNQMLPFLADQQGFSEVKQNGSLILHGGFAGLGWTF
jgi:hypothetical protein